MAGAHAFVTLLTALLWWAGRRAASYLGWRIVGSWSGLVETRYG